MAKTTPEEREILRAKIVLEERIADAIYVVTNRFHEEHPAWMITAADLGIIDIVHRDRLVELRVVRLTQRFDGLYADFGEAPVYSLRYKLEARADGFDFIAGLRRLDCRAEVVEYR